MMDFGGIFQAMSERCTKANPIQSTDFLDCDGLWVCGKCGKRKQTRIVVGGETITVNCACRCVADREAKQKESDQKKQIEEIRKKAFPDAAMRNWTFAADDGKSAEIMRVARAYVDKRGTMLREGKGLLLYGSVGCGKTFAAVCIANALIDEAFTVIMTSFARLVGVIRPLKDPQEYIDGLNAYQMLIIDDFAAERDTEYMGEIVQNVIDTRYNAGLPLIVTTNLTAEEIRNAQDIRRRRIFSRLYDMCIPVECKGEDRRRENLKDKFSDYKKILGIHEKGEA